MTYPTTELVLVGRQTPLITGVLSVATVVALPWWERACATGTIPWIASLLLTATMVWLSHDAVAQHLHHKRPIRPWHDDTLETTDFMVPRKGRTLVEPADWVATHIWTPILFGERIIANTFAFMAVGFPIIFIIANRSIVKGLRSTNCFTGRAFGHTSGIFGIGSKASASWMAAQMLQALWAVTFRRRKHDANNQSHRISHIVASLMSSMMLTAIALSLNRMHLSFVQWDPDWYFYLYHFGAPSLHFAWSTVVALMSWNDSLAATGIASQWTMAVVGCVSTLVVAVLGMAVTVKRTAPVYGLTMIWAMLGWADTMRKRIKEQLDPKAHVVRNNARQQQHALVDAKVGLGAQQMACTIGCWLVGAATWFTMTQNRIPKVMPVAP